MPSSGKQDHARINAEIIAGLDIISEYRELGVTFAADEPRASGKIECHAYGRDDRKPSAWIDTTTGFYGDSSGDSAGAGGKPCSLWEFAAKHHPGKFHDWKAARNYYAEKAGVSGSGKSGKSGNSKNGSGGGKSSGGGSGGTSASAENPAEVLEFLDWNEGRERLTRTWGAIYKPFISVEAIKLAGGRIARYPCYNSPKNSERVIGNTTVLALPCYTRAPDPAAWVIWNINSGTLEVYRGKGRPPDHVKMKSVGPTADTFMGLHGLLQLAKSAAARRNPAAVVEPHSDATTPAAGSAQPGVIEVVWKTAGPTDMLALMTAILRDTPHLVDSHLVITNANGEAGDPPKWAGELLAGHRVYVVNDLDEAGRNGNAKWAVALAPHVAEWKIVHLQPALEAPAAQPAAQD